MKQTITTACTLIAFAVTAQTTLVLDENNASVRISDNGIFFTPGSGGEAGYEIPKGDGVSPIYTAAFWMAGVDGDGALHGACNEYEGEYDWFAGPIADDYSSTYYTENFGTSIWKVSKEEIQTHKTFYTVSGYEPVDAIANWPGNGNSAEGIADQLAPYVDVNGDMLYNPLDGDYPYIQGDAAVYVILNDAKELHLNSGGDQLGAELHIMFYQYDTADEDLNNTTFMNAKVYNRSTSGYFDLHFGLFNDYDLGNYADDFVGSDSLRGLTYVYNSIDSDGQYGSNAPAFGTKLLSHSMASAMAYENTTGPMGNPNFITQHYNYLQGKWSNGSPAYYGGNGFDEDTSSVLTTFLYTGEVEPSSGWTEITTGNAGGDRRMLLGSESTTLVAGDYLCADFAFIYSRNGTTNVENAADLKHVADWVQDFYDNEIQACSNIHVGLTTNEDPMTVDIYPNPTASELTVEAEGTYQLNLLSMEGKLVKNLGVHNGLSSVQLSVESGIYLLELSTGHARLVRKVQVVR